MADSRFHYWSSFIDAISWCRYWGKPDIGRYPARCDARDREHGTGSAGPGARDRERESFWKTETHRLSTSYHHYFLYLAVRRGCWATRPIWPTESEANWSNCTNGDRVTSWSKQDHSSRISKFQQQKKKIIKNEIITSKSIYQYQINIWIRVEAGGGGA